MAPVAPGIEINQSQFPRKAEPDPSGVGRNLPGNEFVPSSRGFVVIQDAVAGEDAMEMP